MFACIRKFKISFFTSTSSVISESTTKSAISTTKSAISTGEAVDNPSDLPTLRSGKSGLTQNATDAVSAAAADASAPVAETATVGETAAAAESDTELSLAEGQEEGHKDRQEQKQLHDEVLELIYLKQS